MPLRSLLRIGPAQHPIPADSGVLGDGVWDGEAWDIHPDFPVENNGEGLFLYARIEPYLTAWY